MARPRKQPAGAQPSLLLPDAAPLPEIPVAEQPYPLPTGWKWIYWGNCGNFIAGNAFKPTLQGKKNLLYPFYKVASLKYSDNEGYLYDTENSIGKETQERIKSTIIPEHSIIFAKIGEAIRLNRRGINKTKCCIDNNLIAFIPETVFFRFAYHWSQSIDLYKYTNATTVPAIRKSDLKKIAFPLPPREEQERIVARIESLFARLDEAREKVDAVAESYETRKAALLHKAFSGELTAKWREEKGVSADWRNVLFIHVAEVKSNLVDPADFQDFPHIAPDNIEKKTGRLFQYNTIAKDMVTSGKHRFYPGQILYSKIRPYLSKVVITDFDGLCSADMYPIEAKENTKYLWYYMLSEDFLEQASTAGSRSVLPKINQKELSRINIRIPTLPEQEEIVRLLDSLLERERQIREAAEQVRERIDLMKKAILARAFRGELG
ncbi:MAG TPA: restriction endonuclease subunit S [Candidatus Desulfovibrio intestinavium]|uniref:Restriction endonuclease subunit S n=1 Tax=Candidatus Desulfovibrio intestinavium TaxID=2838534 RepID=A0A9D2HLU4_9BACT|nr:restriction endonuclease subunit S [Candidatus Desulfovibrio intestinavium]